jgi:hypothetical protein
LIIEKIKKIIYDWILPILSAALFLYLCITLPKSKLLWLFLITHSFGLITFFLVFCIICVGSMLNYYKTLGFFEEETTKSGVALKQNVRIWAIFWSLWSLYCSIITIAFNKTDWKIVVSAGLLAIVPGFIAFLVSHDTRLAQIKEDKDERKRLGEKYSEEKPYTLFTEKKYHSGYYGLICIPIFIWVTIIGLVIKNIF